MSYFTFWNNSFFRRLQPDTYKHFIKQTFISNSFLLRSQFELQNTFCFEREIERDRQKERKTEGESMVFKFFIIFKIFLKILHLYTFAYCFV